MHTVDFAIIELEDGLTVVDIPRGQDPKDVAAKQGARLVDADLYSSYEDACDAMANLQMDDEEERG